jgi:hypothetical protein
MIQDVIDSRKRALAIKDAELVSTLYNGFFLHGWQRDKIRKERLNP